MTVDQVKQLRGFFHSLKYHEKNLSSLNRDDHNLIGPAGKIIIEEITKIKDQFPNFVLSVNLDTLGDSDFYDINGLKAIIGSILGRIEPELAEVQDTPVTQIKEFIFIQNPKLREIIERDYQEIQRAFVAQCWKSALILAGGLIEAILLDGLEQKRDLALASSNAPKKPDLSKWDLSNLIEVSVELQLVTSGVEKLSHPIREFRNLVHPGNELRKKLTYGGEEARIGLEVLNMIHRDLKTPQSP